MSAIRERLQQAADFINHDIWRIHRTKLPRSKSFFLTFLRVLILSIRGFDEDKCQLRASSLTFYSLVSIVPVAAMAFGIAKGFGFEKLLEQQLHIKLAGHEEILTRIIQFSKALLENTRGGMIAGVGLILLFWAVLKVLGQIEYAFNDIWGIQERRSFGRMFGDYLSLILICPVIIILAGSLNVFITTQVNLIMERVAILEAMGTPVFLILEWVPYALLWGLFTFLYLFMPNTKVRFSAALIAGVITGTLFQIVQWGYITFQVGVVKYNAIYGSFAALPLFLLWLQLSWFIVLYGAELSFAYQSVDTYEFEPDARQASQRIKTLLSLQIARHLIQNFTKGEKPPTAREISGSLEIPIRFVNDILFNLIKSGIVSITEAGSDGERAYQPARDVNVLTIHYVMDALDRSGADIMPFGHKPEFETLAASVSAFGRTVEQLPDNKLLREV